MTENKSSEQLEEGEIVDDDLEDISDNSIIDSTFGKFVSSNENLRAVSLSSGSDDETDSYKNVKCKRKQLLHRKCRVIRHHRKRKKLKQSSSSDSDENSTYRDLKEKLKDAIHISDIAGDGQKNPLEKRLKAMGGLIIVDAITADNTECAKTEPIEAQPAQDFPNDKEHSEKIDDNELEMLRIEALKTAVLNKFQRRKRKKAELEEEQQIKSLEPAENNKENDTPKPEITTNINTQHNNIEVVKVEIKNPTPDLEEDEDVLRASLLAGLAKKVTKVSVKTEKPVFVKTKPMAPALPIKITPKPVPVAPKPQPISVKTTVVNKIVQNRPKPLVKPLIININGDSDSEEEVKQKEKSPEKVTDLKVITNSVEKFLKEQRAKFETETEKKVQPLLKNSKNKSILEKSAVKLLPKSQQIEYQQLLRRLKTAERRKRARKLALQKPKPTTTQPVQVSQPKIDQLAVVEVVAPTVEVVAHPQAIVHPVSGLDCNRTSKVDISDGRNKLKPDNNCEEKDQEASLRDSDSEKSEERRKPKIIGELTMLQRTLKEIKIQRNGSFQIKSKYQVLKPVIRKITTANNDRKRHEEHIKTLTRELNEARSKLSKSHEIFSQYVKELVHKKDKIDKSCRDSRIPNKNTRNGTIVKKPTQVNVEKAEGYNIKDTKTLPMTSTPIKNQSNGYVIPDNASSTTMSSITINSTNNDECEDMDVCYSDETDVCQIDIVDPNDIDQIFKRRAVPKSTIPEYVSPLNYIGCERYSHVDPLGIMCPYEVNGSCRDIDCTFKHYLKNHERL